jgi:UDP-2,4-diacetamido-2,4,6-trideoxy-beta-L-altropyranose hydrolase
LRQEGANVVSIVAERASLADARETAKRAREARARWIVLDGSEFSGDYQVAVRDSDLFLMVIDDEAREANFAADLLLNHNAWATPELYAHKIGRARLALGGRYALLRDEFKSWQLWRREIPESARRILITTGGSDPHKATLQILRGLDPLNRKRLETTVVIGSAAAHREEVEREAAVCGAKVVVDARNMPELMAWADLAISAAGGTCWEMAFMGLPALTLVTADNQERIARCLSERGAALSLGRADESTHERVAACVARLLDDPLERTTLSRAGRRLIDGRGASRVVELLSEAA